MKKSSLLSLAALGLLGTVTPLIDPLPKAAEPPVYQWNYTSYEFGFGVGCFHAKWPKALAKTTEILLPNDAAALKQGPIEKIMPPRSSISHVILPDIRLGFEKSWHFARNWTATFDFALMTPSATCGYLISPRTRLFMGAHYSLLLNFGYTTQTQLQSTTTKSPDGRTITHSTESIDQVVKTKNPFLGLAPRLGVDHFLSPATMLRISISCDAQKLYDTHVKTNTGSLVWPQLSVGIKKFF